jgi:ADP-ribosylglycohydrolase
MKGAIAGDIIGSSFEQNPVKEKHFNFFYRPHKFTDDTVLTLAIADSLLNNKNYADSISDYALKYPNRNYGKTFKIWIERGDKKPYESFGNGSAMRVSPIGWSFNNLDDVLLEAKKSSEITHNHPEGIKGAQAVASAIFLARNNASKNEIKEYLENNFSYNLSKKYEDFQPEYKHDFSAQGSVPEAIICFLESNDFEDAIRNAVALGGDSDTQACIAGSISEAFYKGVPDNIWEQCQKKLNSEIIELIDSFYDRLKIRFI